MDLNHLFARHQVSLVNAALATSPEARCSHDGLARAYAAQIAVIQSGSGATSPMSGIAL